MTDAMPTIFTGVVRFSRIGVAATFLIFAFFKLVGHELNLSTQITIALVGLLIGVPHGAIDHLVSIPRKSNTLFITYLVIYIALALLAGAAIATWNLFGFRIVVIMSALHFGYGDAAFRYESRASFNLPKLPWVINSIYAIPAGFVPVVLPLTDPKALSALHRIHPTLGNWAGHDIHQIRTITIALVIAAIVILLARGYFALALDLGLLAVLALSAPPLVAFAAYFGFWHASRHTVRLVLALPNARSLAGQNKAKSALWAAIFPGLYALVGTLVLATTLMLGNRHHFSSGLLWSSLVVVWALTVPHMISTARLDFKAFSPLKS